MKTAKLYFCSALYWVASFFRWCRGHRKFVKKMILECLFLLVFLGSLIFICGAIG